MIKIKSLLLISALIVWAKGYSQKWNVNYDELKITPYSLPPILRSNSGMNINNVADWERFRKPELISDFQNHIYGIEPGNLDTMKVTVNENNAFAFNGSVKRKQVTLTFVRGEKEFSANLLIYLPITPKKVPVFLGYNFFGNHTISDDPAVPINKRWMRNRPEYGITENIANEKSRGVQESSWPVEKIVQAGYGLVTLYCGDIALDKNDFSEGVYTLFYEKGQSSPKPGEWGAIAAWSWGLSRVMDYLEKDVEIDNEKVIVLGHSRLGKAALWAGAKDVRFAATVSNNSGCMGAALSRRVFGETVEVINTAFPHWFCGNFKKYSNKEYLLPVDQHMLISLIAPRPIYIASATEDLWADPKGEFLSAKEASIVYNLYGIQGLSSTAMPESDTPIINKVSYHLKSGKHSISEYDWEQYIKFAELL